MRIFILITILINIVPVVHADELEKAYQKEYAYLVAERKALQERLKSIDKTQGATISRMNKEIDALQAEYLSRQNETDRMNQLVVDVSREADYSENDKLLMETTLLQATDSLSKNGITLDESKQFDEQLAGAFKHSVSLLNEDGQLREEGGKFFLADGKW